VPYRSARALWGDLCVFGEGKRSIGATICWRSVYEILAILDTATRVPGGEHE
jgi:hypothetical protein